MGKKRTTPQITKNLPKRKGIKAGPNRKVRKDAILDMSEAIKLYFVNNLSEREIATHFGVSPQTVNIRLKPFKRILHDKETLEVFKANKTRILESLQLTLLSEMAKEGKLKDASVNNIAYAFSKIFDATRLEMNKSTSNVALAYGEISQELESAEKALADYEQRHQKADTPPDTV